LASPVSIRANIPNLMQYCTHCLLSKDDTSVWCLLKPTRDTTRMRSVVAYYGVSTDKQSKAGLGIEAQREAVQRFVAAEGLALLAEHTEVETGKGADAIDRRPVLREALAEAKRAKAGGGGGEVGSVKP
jgi:hypothetical protein